MIVQNISEVRFEEYLQSQGLSFEHEKSYPGKHKLVDYTVPLNGREFLFEVKQFEQKNYPLPTGGATFFDPYHAIRSKIEQAKDKFKEYDGFPCCLVMYNSNDAFVMATEPNAVLGAMYGEIGIQIPVAAGVVTVASPPPPTSFVGNLGKMLRKSKVYNTRISALITLYEYNIGFLRAGRWLTNALNSVRAGEISLNELPQPDFDASEKVLAVSVWKNVYADIEFPDEIFRGCYDEHWGAVGEYIRRTYIGSGRVED